MQVLDAIIEVRSRKYKKVAVFGDQRPFTRRLEDYLKANYDPTSGMFKFQFPFWQPIAEICEDAFCW